MPSDPGLIRTPGRIAPTPREWDRIVGRVGYAPTILRGEIPRRSPDNRAFANKRYRGQLIGDCVGENVTQMTEALLRMPADRRADSAPLPAKSLSPLLTYWLARKYARDKGINLGGEGAIVSHAIEAIDALGVASYDLYPATPENYRGYSDRRPPPAAATEEAARHSIKEKAVLDTPEKMLTFLGGGFVLAVGAAFPHGMLQTDDTGYFAMRGANDVGHCVCVYDYDLDANKVWIGNSWANARWGARTDDPEYPPECQGHSNIGWTQLDAFLRWFTPRMMQSGQSEAVVANDVEGWAPKVRSFVEVL